MQSKGDYSMKHFLTIILVLSLLTGCTKGSSNGSFNATTMEAAMTSPFSAYPETVNYTIAHLDGVNNSNMPEGDTYEDNAYTRYLKQTLNIQNVNVMHQSRDQYFANIDMMISSKELPDVMIIDDYETLHYLVEQDMIEDLTEAYKNCASERIKSIYNSYDASIIDNVTINGRLFAMPETNIDDGPNLFWVRQDWINRLGLSAPETLDDVETIVKAFVEDNPGNNDEGQTVGLMVNPILTAGTGYSSEYLLDLYFAAYNSYPQQWIKKKGEIIYGSVDSRAKKALAHIHRLYDEGIIDQQFLFRTSDDIKNEIVEGHCGCVFGPWWFPNNPLIYAWEADPSALWKPYLIATNEQGETRYHTIDPSGKYVVVRKGFEHPEIVFKIISVLFDQVRYIDKNVQEINDYDRTNVDPTARPISINVDYNDALHRSYTNIKKIFNDETDEDISSLDEAFARAVMGYANRDEESSLQNRAAYFSRVEALSLLETDKIKKVQSYFFGTTASMDGRWTALKALEQETYLKIIIGEKSIDEFDDFVKKWNDEGGQTITKEVRGYIKNYLQ